MADIADLERRVVALETAQKETAQTQTWMAQTLGRIAAVQDDHTKRLEDHSQRLERIEADVSGLRQEFKGFQGSFAATVADVMREVIKEGKP